MSYAYNRAWHVVMLSGGQAAEEGSKVVAVIVLKFPSIELREQ